MNVLSTATSAYAEELTVLSAKNIDIRLNKFNTISTYGVLCKSNYRPYMYYFFRQYATSGFEIGWGYFVFPNINFGINFYNFNYHPAATYLTTIGGRLSYYHGNLNSKLMPNIYIEEGVALADGREATRNMIKVGGGIAYKLHRNIRISIAFEKLKRFNDGDDYIYSMYKVGILGMIK